MTFPFNFPFTFPAAIPTSTPAVFTSTNTVLPPMPAAPHISTYPTPAWDNAAMDPNLRPSVRVTGYRPK